MLLNLADIICAVILFYTINLMFRRDVKYKQLLQYEIKYVSNQPKIIYFNDNYDYLLKICKN